MHKLPMRKNVGFHDLTFGAEVKITLGEITLNFK
jgi:hypothetical protein